MLEVSISESGVTRTSEIFNLKLDCKKNNTIKSIRSLLKQHFNNIHRVILSVDKTS